MNASGKREDKLLKEYNKLQTTKSYAKSITTSDEFGNSISTIVAGAAFFPLIPHSINECFNPKQENKKMHISSTDPHRAAREHLINRAYCAREEHNSELEKHFHIVDTDTSDWSFEDFTKAVKDGMFEFRNKESAAKKGVFSIYDVSRHIRLRDPSKPANHGAFKAAEIKMFDAFKSVEDSIVIKEPKDALNDVDKFRKATFH